MDKPKLLLINPYIYDFSAYDLWLKPLGLLYLASILEENGFEVVLLDCMDRWNDDVLKLQGLTAPKSKKYGIGHFYKETVEKPVEFAGVKRYYACYGMPPRIVRESMHRIQQQHNIQMVLVTSGMTYWYRAVHEVIGMAHEYFPKAKVLLGGIYATLFTEYARRKSGADFVFKGEGERPVLDMICSFFNKKPQKEYHGYDDFPYPAYYLYQKLEYIAMMTSRGCPFTCSFCATHQFTESFKRRIPEKVAEEIDFYVRERKISDIAFYDDALFVNSQHHIKPILRSVIDKKLKINFHTPNGLFAKLLDEELAELLVKSGFKTIRLSFETRNPERQKQMRKVKDCDLQTALENLEKAGFPKHEVTVYLMMGLPHQQPSEVEDSIRYVHQCGAKSSLSSFSPIPGTPEWDISVRDFSFVPDEPLLTNKSVYPLKNTNFSEQHFEALKRLAIELNRKVMPDNEDSKISDYNVYA